MRELHRVLFGSKGKRNNIRSNILSFSGFVFEVEKNEEEREKEREKVREKMEKMNLSVVKEIAKLLGLHVAGTKHDVVVRFVMMMMVVVMMLILLMTIVMKSEQTLMKTTTGW